MLTVVLIMLCGMAAGYALRQRRMTFAGRVVTPLVWLLLFLLGVEVGGNPDMTSGFGRLGVEALALSFGGVAGSVVLAWLLWRSAGRPDGN